MVTKLRLPETQRRLEPIEFPDLIRLGRAHDGGYVVPRKVIEQADSVLALGLSDDWSFEEAVQKFNPAVRIDAYDHTIGHERFVRNFWIDTVRFFLRRIEFEALRRRLETVRSYGAFFRGPNRHYSQKITNRPADVSEATVTAALDRLSGASVIVKMDIEGSEYRVFEELVANEHRVLAACIEFHDVEPLRAVFDKAIKTLLSRFVIAHVHPNNYGSVADDGLPDVLEITFVNRRLSPERAKRRSIYLPKLDQPNDPARAELAILA